MDTTALLLAYTAAALVALGVTASFSKAIDRMVERILPEAVASHWNRVVKFAMFVAAFAGGAPASNYVDRTPGAPPPATADGVMVVMGSAVGALMTSVWALLLIFGLALAALGGEKLWAIVMRMREAEAKRPQPPDEPVRRQEPAETRPVAKEKREKQPK
jgi:hypothetical protein